MVTGASNRRGSSSTGCLLTLLLFSAALYYGINIGEVYWRFYQYQDEMRSQARLAPSLAGRRDPPPTAPHRGPPRPAGGGAEDPDQADGPPSPDHHRERVRGRGEPAALQAHLPSSAPTPSRGCDRMTSASPALFVTLILLVLRRSGRRPGGNGHDIPAFLLTLAAILVGAKLFGELAERIGQPAVLGELVAGVLLGSSALGVIPAAGPIADVITILAELGVLILLFEIGLETDLREMRRVGELRGGRGRGGRSSCRSWPVTSTGRNVPHGMGNPTTCLDRGGLHRRRAHRHLGRHHGPRALRPVAPRLHGRAHHHRRRGHRRRPGPRHPDRRLRHRRWRIGFARTAWRRILAVAVGFLVVAIAIGGWVAPAAVHRRRAHEGFLRHPDHRARPRFGLAALADLAGSALIMGAFAAGIILARTEQANAIEHRVRPVGALLTPIFFVSVGSSLDVNLLNPMRPGGASLLLVALGLTDPGHPRQGGRGVRRPLGQVPPPGRGCRHGAARRGRPHLRRRRPPLRPPHRRRLQRRAAHGDGHHLRRAAAPQAPLSGPGCRASPEPAR